MNKIKVMAVAGLLFFAGCRVSCVNNNLSPVLIGFSPSEIDTFIIRGFKPNDGYRQLVDTLMVEKGIGIYTVTNDTTFVCLNIDNAQNYLCSNFDWQIYLPAKNQTFAISNIVGTQTEGPGKVCYNPINSISAERSINGAYGGKYRHMVYFWLSSIYS